MQQQEPTTFAQLEQLLFPTCEAFLDAARRVAARDGVSLTITHKSRNTPGKASSQYRGCLVLNCVEWGNNCTFEIKAYGPIDGGWRMRPLQHPGLKKHTVTSWALCDHARVPLRVITPPDVTNWEDLLPIPFAGPDEIIAAVHHVAAHQHVELYLLTLMISDGKPKPNGRNTMYIPRGFLTLECVEAGNGCPMAIKCREEANGWFVRPWREKGRTELKGAVSTIGCKHGPDVAAAYHAKMASKETKSSSKSLKSKRGSSEPGEPENLDVAAPQAESQPDISSGLVDPALMASGADYPPLSQEEILGVIENSFAGNHQFMLNDTFPSSFASTSATNYASSVDEFRRNLSTYPNPAFSVNGNGDIAVPTMTGPSATTTTTKGSKRNSDETPPRSPKRARKNAAAFAATTAATDAAPDTVTWKAFLEALDPGGRLNVLTPSLTKDGGIDPGAVVNWPPNDVSEFVDTVAGDVPHGVRIHFRVLLVGVGKQVWKDLCQNSKP